MTTRRIIGAGLFILSLIYLSSCDEMFDERIEGNNTMVMKERTVTTFDEV